MASYKEEVLGKHVVVQFVVNKSGSRRPFLGKITEVKIALQDNGDLETQHLVWFDDGDRVWFDLTAEEAENRLTWINVPSNPKPPRKKQKIDEEEEEDTPKAGTEEKQEEEEAEEEDVPVEARQPTRANTGTDVSATSARLLRKAASTSQAGPSRKANGTVAAEAAIPTIARAGTARVGTARDSGAGENPTKKKEPKGESPKESTVRNVDHEEEEKTKEENAENLSSRLEQLEKELAELRGEVQPDDKQEEKEATNPATPGSNKFRTHAAETPAPDKDDAKSPAYKKKRKSFAPLETLGENDVLLGRGGASNKNKGNATFRNLIASKQPVYMEARKHEKKGIAEECVTAVLQSGGRFLKWENGTWVEVPKAQAVKKASQTLWDDARNKRSKEGEEGSGEDTKKQSASCTDAPTATAARVTPAAKVGSSESTSYSRKDTATVAARDVTPAATARNSGGASTAAAALVSPATVGSSGNTTDSNSINSPTGKGAHAETLKGQKRSTWKRPTPKSGHKKYMTEDMIHEFCAEQLRSHLHMFRDEYGIPAGIPCTKPGRMHSLLKAFNVWKTKTIEF